MRGCTVSRGASRGLPDDGNVVRSLANVVRRRVRVLHAQHVRSGCVVPPTEALRCVSSAARRRRHLAKKGPPAANGDAKLRPVSCGCGGEAHPLVVKALSVKVQEMEQPKGDVVPGGVPFNVLVVCEARMGRPPTGTCIEASVMRTRRYEPMPPVYVSFRPRLGRQGALTTRRTCAETASGRGRGAAALA